MKFLRSSSSSSTTSKHQFSDHKSTAAAAGCFPGVLRRLLFFHGFLTQPFDHRMKESEEFEELFCHGNPGVVAKLMGLDSMPQRCHNQIEQRGSVTRTQSMTCVDNHAEFKSGRKPPSFVELEDDEFFIFSFEGGDKYDELELKPHKGLEDNKNLRNEENFTAIKKVEGEFDPENSSPVSVLDFVEFPGYQDVPVSDEDSRSNSRRKLNGDVESCKHGSSSTHKTCVGLNKNDSVIKNFGGMWGEICNLAERETMCRVHEERWKGEDFEEIGVDFELEIFDQLILELFTSK